MMEEKNDLLPSFRYGERPSGWWCYEAPEPRGNDESQLQFLERHDLLLLGEREKAITQAQTEAGKLERLRRESLSNDSDEGA
jgi:hypothetical protein